MTGAGGDCAELAAGRVSLSVAVGAPQVMVPSVRNPHEWNPPAVTVLNCPPGASACPPSLEPQQVMVGTQPTRMASVR